MMRLKQCILTAVLVGCFATNAVGEEPASRIQSRLEPAPDASRLAARSLPHIVFRLNLPPLAFPEKTIVLTATITPILAGGTNGTPVVLDDLQITSPEPTRLVLAGLVPGDYPLALEVSGDISLPRVGRLIQVRKDPRPVKVTGRVVFDDRDWRGADAVASATNVETRPTPDALLMTEFTRPVPAFDPTDDETITCMAQIKGKLFPRSSDRPSRQVQKTPCW